MLTLLHRQYVPVSSPDPEPVTFICANTDEPAHWPFQKDCQKNLRRAAVAYRGTEVIVLCSNTEYGVAPLRSSCPIVRENKLWPDNGALVYKAGFGVLIHELAHVYGIVDEKGIPEVYRIQDAAELDGRRQYLNAQNWAFYASGKCSLYSNNLGLKNAVCAIHVCTS